MLAVVDDKLGLHDIQDGPKLDESTIYLSPGDFIRISECVFLGVEGNETRSLKMVLQNEVQRATELPVPDLFMIDQAYITRGIGVDGFDDHVRGFGQGGMLITEDPS